jgi:hypothetical protein
MGLTNKTKDTLEAIRLAAVQKTRQAIAEKRVASKVDAVQETVKVVRSGIPQRSKDIAGLAARKVADRFISTFQEAISELRERAEDLSAYPGSYRNADDTAIMVYPDGCKFLYVDENNNGVVVIEQVPQVRTLLINTTHKHVPLPYVVFVIQFRKQGNQLQYAGISVGFRTEPLASIDDRLGNPPLPNFTGHNVCMGSYQGPPRAGTVGDIAEDVIGTFWQSVFASDFPRFTLKGKSVSSWSSWEKIENPLDILKARFTQGSTVRELFRVVPNNRYSHAALQDIVQGVWRNMAKEITPLAAEIIIRESAEGILNSLLEELTLQPK